MQQFGNLRPEVSTTSPVLRTLIKNLAILNEHERRMDALLTLTEGQDDEELVVLRAVFRQLVDNACELVSKQASNQDRLGGSVSIPQMLTLVGFML